MKFLFCLPMIAILLVAGCNSGPDLYPVSGTVTYQEKPLPLGTIMFIPKDKGLKPAVGTIDENGHYQLKTAAGSYAVQIQMVAQLREKATAGGSEASAIRMPEVDWLIPEKYSYTQSSGLTAVVEAGENQPIDFPLE